MSLNKTEISYLDYTWNPITMRCTPISPGCANCWHLAFADRLSLNPTLSTEKRKAYAGGPPVIDSDVKLNIVLRRKKPAVIGVQFMGDLFHESIPIQWVNKIFSRMDNAPWHTFIILTKRPHRALEMCGPERHPWKNNVWFFFSAEDQQRLDERAEFAMQIPAKIHGVSIEPMIGPMDLTKVCYPACGCKGDPDCDQRGSNLLSGEWSHYDDESGEVCTHWDKPIDIVIAGGEKCSKSKARPMEPAWPRALRDQCIEHGTLFNFKQWGTYGLNWYFDNNHKKIPGSEWMDPMGARMAGRLLDGVLWDQWPGKE